MDDFFSGLRLSDFHDDLYRNIVSLRDGENLFDDLSDSPESWQAAIELEGHTKPHTHTSAQPIIDRPFEEADYFNAIEYPFKEWCESRYSDGSFGVWYGADELETTVYETVYHWHNGLLGDAGWDTREGVAIERSVYRVRCDAALLDFLPKLADYPDLINKSNYRFTHQVGGRINNEGHPGLVTLSARCECKNYVVFNQTVLSNPRQNCYLTYFLEKEEVRIERNPGEIILRVPRS